MISLKQYKENRKLSYQELAKFFGTTPQNLYRWCVEGVMPRGNFIRVIEDATNMQVNIINGQIFLNNIK